MSRGHLTKKEEVLQTRIKKRKELLRKGATLGYQRPEGFPEGGEIKNGAKDTE